MHKINNAIVRQKNRVYDSVWRGDLSTAVAALEVLAELWRAANYGYKLRELCLLIREVLATRGMQGQPLDLRTKSLLDGVQSNEENQPKNRTRQTRASRQTGWFRL